MVCNISKYHERLIDGCAEVENVSNYPVVQVYAARCCGWRGVFAVHTWIAVKAFKETFYTVYEVLGWRGRFQQSSLMITNRAPDSRWFGALPEKLLELRGKGVDQIINRIDEVARCYPYRHKYRQRIAVSQRVSVFP